MQRDPRYVDVWADDVVTLSLQYSTQWDSLAHVGAWRIQHRFAGFVTPP